MLTQQPAAEQGRKKIAAHRGLLCGTVGDASPVAESRSALLPLLLFLLIIHLSSFLVI
jgi:hypothetical protein